MDGVCEELDKVKAWMEKLKEECRTKTELSESLRKAHNEQLTKFHEAKLQIEKQAQELNAKSEEISELRQLYEDLKSSLHAKELFLRHLSSANEELRVDYGERFQKLEGENRDLALALDEAMARIQDLELKICAGNEETEGLKRFLSNREKTCLEAEQKVQAFKELKRRDDLILKLEEENRNVQDKLKWKNEQFKNLEEAHIRLQDQFRSSKEEWEREKSALLEEICSLETRLDSQTRISESLQTQLTMCNQALAHEESRRNILEVEVSEFKLRFENVISECEQAKSKIEHLTLKRDEEIAKLRNSFGTKETLFKELEYRNVHLEQEKRELMGSLKEFQEAKINNAGATSLLKKLQNKIQGLEQLHNKCSVNLKEKEAEWSSRMEKLTGDMNGYLFDLKFKNKQIQEFQMELEGCHCLLDFQDEEISLVIMVLKSEFSEAYSKLFSEKAEMELHNKAREEKNLLLMEQLEMKNNDLCKVQIDLDQKCEEVAFLMERVESFDHMKQQQIFMEEELEMQKKMLAESSECQLCLKERILQMEYSLKQGSKDISDALEKANSELAKNIREVNLLELELQKWKYKAKNLKVCLEENCEAHKGENESLLGIVKEQDEKIGNLQQQIVLLESTIAAKTEVMQAFKQEKEQYIQIAEDKNSSIDSLQNEIAYLQESVKRELEGVILTQKAFEQEKESLLQIIKQKEQSIEDLSEHAKSLERDLTNAAIRSSEKQIEIDVLNEALETAENLRKVEIEDKNKTIVELEMEVKDSRQKLEVQEKSLFHSKQQAEQLEALLQANKLETEKAKNQFGNERMHLEGLVKELEFHKGALLEDITKLSSDREDLLIQVEGIVEQISEFSGKDVELMGILGKILQKSEKEKGQEMNLIASAALYSTSGNVNTPYSLFTSTKGTEESIDKRSPLMELNN